MKFLLLIARSSLLSRILTGKHCSRYLSKSLKSQKIQHSFLFEMIFAFLLLLQLVQYNVQGKHYLVETEGEQDEPTMNRMSQVYDHKYDINEYKYDHMSTFYSCVRQDTHR